MIDAPGFAHIRLNQLLMFAIKIRILKITKLQHVTFDRLSVQIPYDILVDITHPSHFSSELYAVVHT
jgi:hypothetical protein